MPKSLALLAASLLLLALLAFWPHYLSKSWSAIDAYTHAHAFFGTVWMLGLIAQPLLILRGHRLAHRINGRFLLVFALAFVVSGALLAHFRISRMPDETFAREGHFVYLPLSVAFLFGCACALGYRWRRTAAIHARFMATTALMLVDPVLARILFFYLPPLPFEELYQGTSFALIAVAMAFLVKSLPATVAGRGAYRNFCVFALVVLALFFVVPHTGAWVAFAQWFRALPLT